MRHLVILGGGTAGTMIANKLRHRFDRTEWSITVVDRDDEHHYQPGYLFLPFGGYSREQVVRSRHAFLPDGVDFVVGAIDRVEPGRRTSCSSRAADGCPTTSWSSPPARPRARTRRPGMLGPEWRRSIFDFYTLEGAEALARGARREFDGGRLVVHITEMPIKCPVAPLEFTFLAEAWLRERGHPRPGRAGLRDPAGRGVHQAGGLGPPGRDARRAQGARRDRLHGRADRPRAEDARLLRRARGPVRPAGDGPAEHGRRLRRPLRARRRAQLRARRQAHPALDGVRQHLRRSATPATSPPPRPARSRTSRSRSSSTTSSSTSRADR